MREVCHLKAGDRFTLAGEEHELLYVNECRALVKPVAIVEIAFQARRDLKDPEIDKKKVAFQAPSKPYSISPHTRIQ